MQNAAFWEMLTQMVEKSDIVIDRPKHSRHPRMSHIIYPVDYGYLKTPPLSMGKVSTSGWAVSRKKRCKEFFAR